MALPSGNIQSHKRIPLSMKSFTRIGKLSVFSPKNALCGDGRDLAGSALDIQEKGQVISFVRHSLDVADDVYIVGYFGLKKVTGYFAI